MNTPDIDKIIKELAQNMDCGLISCLNVETGEIVYKLGDSYDNSDSEDFDKEYDEKVDSWENHVEIYPLDSHESYELMETFIEKKVREGTRLHKRLTDSIKRKKPFASFKNELALCQGLKHWYKFKDRWYEEEVVGEIVETLTEGKVKMLPINEDTLELMALAYLSGRYFYVPIGGKQVIISQVMYQPSFDYYSEEVEELDTHYSITEWAYQKAEEHLFYQHGGGLVYEPFDPNDGLEREKPELDKMVQKIKNAIHWSEEEHQEMEDFIATEEACDNLWDSIEKEDEFADVKFIPPSKENKPVRPDGKFPIHGKRDDEFSDDDPWGTKEDWGF